ncbi:MAG: DNA glycosylase AlkZ-like family protein [Candidatus Limnocylindrales bacterium]
MSAELQSTPVRVTQEQARRFLVLRNGLAPPRALPARPESVLVAMQRLGLLQFDPLEVPGARNHDLVLHARIDGYRREWCEGWLYGPDRRLFEIYNKSLNIVPIEELPHHRVSWERHRDGYETGILHEQADVAHNILQRIAAEGPLSTAAFSDHSKSIDWWWAPTRVARAVLEALFVVGRVGISRRDGNRRYYDLLENLVSEDLLRRRESAEDGMRHRLLSRFRAAGLTSPSAPAELMLGTGFAPERARRTAELVDQGLLTPVEVEGVNGVRYFMSDELELLNKSADARAIGNPGVAFIAPLDPLLWDRRSLREVWSFDYIWEVYVPERKRRWGYYVLPILFGDRLVGRFEPRLDRAERTVRILGIWWEDGFSPRRTEGFVSAMRAALTAYKSFVGAHLVDWMPATAGAGRLFGTLAKI